MKVLFLDIDGVLNSERTCIAFGGFPHEVTGTHRQMFDEVALSLIRGIVRCADVQVVLSSSWRIIHKTIDVANGLHLPIIDATPNNGGPRGKEIDDWLAVHPEVESYVIVDDDSDMLDHQKERFVHTKFRDGLTWDDAARMAQLFGISLYDVNFPGAKEAA